MDKDSQTQQEKDFVSAQVESMKAAGMIPLDLVQKSKRVYECLQKESARRIKKDSVAKTLPIAKWICDFYEEFFSCDSNKPNSFLSQLDLDKLPDNKKREFDLLQEELIKIEADIEQDKRLARQTLYNLMEDISICVNLQKNDYPETMDHISIMRDVDFQYGPLVHPIPLSVHIYVFLFFYYVVEITHKEKKVSEIQMDIIDLFNNDDSETIETFKKMLEDQTQQFSEVAALLQNLSCTIGQSEEKTKEEIWAATNLVANKLNENEIKKFFSKPNQDEIAEWIQLGFLEYCKKQHITIKTPGIPTIISMMNEWNGYLKSRNRPETRIEENKPYPEYDTILFGPESLVIRWGHNTFAPKYIEMKRKKEELKKSKGLDALDRPHAGSNYNIDEKIPSENNAVSFDEEIEDEEDDDNKEKKKGKKTKKDKV